MSHFASQYMHVRRFESGTLQTLLEFTFKQMGVSYSVHSSGGGHPLFKVGRKKISLKQLVAMADEWRVKNNLEPINPNHDDPKKPLTRLRKKRGL